MSNTAMTNVKVNSWAMSLGNKLVLKVGTVHLYADSLILILLPSSVVRSVYSEQ